MSGPVLRPLSTAACCLFLDHIMSYAAAYSMLMEIMSCFWWHGEEGMAGELFSAFSPLCQPLFLFQMMPAYYDPAACFPVFPVSGFTVSTKKIAASCLPTPCCCRPEVFLYYGLFLEIFFQRFFFLLDFIEGV